MPASSISNMSFMSRFSHKSNASTAGKMYKCTVQLLDDSETITIEFKKTETGQDILDEVCEYVQLVEKDYFGLRFMDINKHRYWVDPLKPIFKQIHGTLPIVFCLRVRFYPADPDVVKEELTRYFIYLQLRRDMLHGRLYCPQQESAHLGAYILQSEIGDYNEKELSDTYVSEYKLFLKQTAKLEDRVAEIHKTLTGQTPADAEINFMRHAVTLDTYGFDPYTVKDNKTGNMVYVGMNYGGVLVYHLNRKLHQMPWKQVEKIDYFGKELRIYPTSDYLRVDQIPEPQIEVAVPLFDAERVVRPIDAVANEDNVPAEAKNDENTNNDVANKSSTLRAKPTSVPPLKFTCPSTTFAKHLWKHALSQKAFFTEDHSAGLKPVKSNTFRYSGRVLNEIAEENTAEQPRRDPVPFIRYPPERQPGRDERSYPWARGTAETNNNNHTADSMKYATLPRAARPGKQHAVVDGAVAATDGSQSAREPNAPSPDLIADAYEDSPIVEWTPADSSGDLNHNDDTDGALLANSSTYDSNMSAAARPSSPASANAPRPLATSTPATKSVSFAPTIKHNGHTGASVQPTSGKQSTCGKLVRLLLLAIFVTAIVLVITVCLMETKHSTIQMYVHRVPYEAEFRHHYYEPLREKTLQNINRYINKQTTGGWF